MQMIYKENDFFPNILRCLVQCKKTKNKTTTNPTIFSGHHKPNKAQPSPPPATTNHYKPAKSHHKINKKNHQTHHQPPQTHKKTINPQTITTYNHNKTHSIKTKNNQTTLFKTHKPLQSRVHHEDSHNRAPQRQGVRRRDRRY